MNRRHFVCAVATFGLGGLVAPSAQADLERKVICFRHLSAVATTLRFTQSDFDALDHVHLMPVNQALWINAVRWQNVSGSWEQETIKRNLPPGRVLPMRLPIGTQVLEFSVNPIPLTTATTVVRLTASAGAVRGSF